MGRELSLYEGITFTTSQSTVVSKRDTRILLPTAVLPLPSRKEILSPLVSAVPSPRRFDSTLLDTNPNVPRPERRPSVSFKKSCPLKKPRLSLLELVGLQ